MTSIALVHDRPMMRKVIPQLIEINDGLEVVAEAGSANKHITRDLGFSEATVKVHVKHLLKKLNLRSRVEAAVWAVSNHIV
jgi:DNA-binding NarL/FixJ family response regulator